jgi:hypothetical protein
MNGQNAAGVAKRKGSDMETNAFKKKSSLAISSKVLGGFWLKVTKVDIVLHDATRATTSKKPINRSQATIIAQGLTKHYRTRSKGRPQGLSLPSICTQRITDTDYAVRMLFNADEETMTSGNDNANQYATGEASVELAIGHNYATLRFEPDDASHLSVTHIVPMCKVIDADEKVNLYNSTSATKSISPANLYEMASYLQAPQNGIDAAYVNRDFARLNVDMDGKQTVTIRFAPTAKDSTAIAAAQADGDTSEVDSIYGRADS